MAKDGIIEVEGVVVETLPNTKFIVEIQGGHRLTSYISGKLRDRNIRIAPSYPTLDELQKATDILCLCVKLATVEKLLEE